MYGGDSKSIEGSKPQSSLAENVSVELFNPGNLKIAFHAGVFAFAAWFFSSAGEIFAV